MVMHNCSPIYFVIQDNHVNILSFSKHIPYTQIAIFSLYSSVFALPRSLAGQFYSLSREYLHRIYYFPFFPIDSRAFL